MIVDARIIRVKRRGGARGMTAEHLRALKHLHQLLESADTEALARRLAPHDAPIPPRIPGGSLLSPFAIDKRWSLPGFSEVDREALSEGGTNPAAYECNIEHFIGTVKVPVGIAGPLRVNGLFAHGDYYLPLATTEAALVASYSRGATLITNAGGCSAMLLNEGVSRAPGFVFADIPTAGQFVAWALGQLEIFREIGESTTRFGRLMAMRVTVEGNHVYLIFDYTTGDAAGQNMVTIATEAICQYILANSPIAPTAWYIEANLSGDKKASAQSFETVRGKKATVEVTIPGDLVRSSLHASTKQMVDYWRISAMGGILSGTLGIQGHFANGLAALYLACGQDVACISESAVGVTRFEETSDGSLYATVTLPNLIVGTVGGGTGLPAQRACLQIMGLAGAGHAQALAEVAASLALAGELSIIGALASGEFTRAHARLARRNPRASDASRGTDGG